MKKIYLYISVLFVFTIFSCSSDDSSTNEVDNITTKEWVPSKISLGSLYSLDYPHTEGCDKDFIRIISNNSAIFFSHEQETCNITETEQNWNRNGNQINLKFLNTQISGNIIEESENNLIIEAKATQFADIITTFYPEYESLIPILGSMNFQITLIKKQ